MNIVIFTVFFCFVLFFCSCVIRGVVDDVVAEYVVLPNRITVPLSDIDDYELKHPLPDVSAIK